MAGRLLVSTLLKGLKAKEYLISLNAFSFRFSITDNALENMPWPEMDVYDATMMFKSKAFIAYIQ